MSALKGMFKQRYNLSGKAWIRQIDPEDRRVFVEMGLSYAQHGHLGGMARASTAKRDERGRFTRREN